MSAREEISDCLLKTVGDPELRDQALRLAVVVCDELDRGGATKESIVEVVTEALGASLRGCDEAVTRAEAALGALS